MSLVTPQNWLFLRSYLKFRERMLTEQTLPLLAKLGERAFESSAAAGAFVGLILFINRQSNHDSKMGGVDVSSQATSSEKATALTTSLLHFKFQTAQLKHPESRIVIGNLSLDGTPLSEFATTYEGLHTGDYPRFGRYFWELPCIYWGLGITAGSLFDTSSMGWQRKSLVLGRWRRGATGLRQGTITVGSDDSMDQRAPCVGKERCRDCGDERP